MAKFKNIWKNIIEDFMKGFRMKKMLGFLINNQEPVGLKALNLHYCTRPEREMSGDNSSEKQSEQSQVGEEAPKKEPKLTSKEEKKPKRIQTWNLPSSVRSSDFYKSLKDLEDKK